MNVISVETLHFLKLVKFTPSLPTRVILPDNNNTCLQLIFIQWHDAAAN